MRSVTRQNVKHDMQHSESDPDIALLRASRKRMLLDSFGLSLSTIGFGLVYGLAAREVGLSPVDVLAMSALVFAGGAQFAVLGYIGAGAPWVSIVVVTALINARHLLYGAVLAPYVANLPARVRAAMAYPLSDETFAFTLSHFRRIGYADVAPTSSSGSALKSGRGSWHVVGTAVAGSIAEPAVFGLDVIFPAAMAGLAVGLVTGRRELAAAIAGALVGVASGLLVDPAVGIVSGAVVGPIVGLLIPASRQGERARDVCAMSSSYVLLAALMAAVTYPFRADPAAGAADAAASAAIADVPAAGGARRFGEPGRSQPGCHDRRLRQAAALCRPGMDRRRTVRRRGRAAAQPPAGPWSSPPDLSPWLGLWASVSPRLADASSTSTRVE